VILMTGGHSTQIAIEATKTGAYDYFPKPDAGGFEPVEAKWKWMAQLSEMIDQAVTSKRVLERVRLPGETALGELPASEQMLGKSRVMRDVYKEIGRVARTRVTVLIRGETGTGKELVARALHQHSERAGQPFVAVNCAAVPEALLESELFGHEAGAFTDAKLRRIGRFEQAQGGTIFLDEIGDMNPGTQVKLLRILQERTIQRLGGKEPIRVDVRILAATHRDLESGLCDGTFRSDLYFRLNEVGVCLPPLRERREDIPELAAYFVRRDALQLGWPNSLLSPEAVESLMQQTWPGNVRELRNVIRRALLLARGYPITPQHVSKALSPISTPVSRADQTMSHYIASLLTATKREQLFNVESLLRATLERELYGQAIKRANGDQSQAARWLGVSRPTMRAKLTRYGLLPGDGAAGESSAENDVAFRSNPDENTHTTDHG
jgi:DNA-binding NtrC family response regulator